MWQNLQLDVSNCLHCCGRTMGGENCSGAREHFWTAVFFCCELQISICLMSSISATSDTVILPSSWMRTLACSTWSWVRDNDGRPDRASSRHISSYGFKCFYPFINVSLTVHLSIPYCAKIIQRISVGLTPSAQRYLITNVVQGWWTQSRFIQTDNAVLCDA
jgi:hypothetical protein